MRLDPAVVLPKLTGGKPGILPATAGIAFASAGPFPDADLSNLLFQGLQAV